MRDDADRERNLCERDSDGSFLLVGSNAESVLRRFVQDKSATRSYAFTSSPFFNFVHASVCVEVLRKLLGVADTTHPLYQQPEILHELDRWLIRDLQMLVWSYIQAPPQPRLVIFDTNIYDTGSRRIARRWQYRMRRKIHRNRHLRELIVQSARLYLCSLIAVKRPLELEPELRRHLRGIFIACSGYELSPSNLQILHAYLPDLRPVDIRTVLQALTANEVLYVDLQSRALHFYRIPRLP